MLPYPLAIESTVYIPFSELGTQSDNVCSVVEGVTISSDAICDDGVGVASPTLQEHPTKSKDKVPIANRLKCFILFSRSATNALYFTEKTDPALVETTFLESDEMKCFHKARIRFIQYNNRLRYSNCLKIWIYIHIRRAQRKLWRSGCKPTCARGPKNNIRARYANCSIAVGNQKGRRIRLWSF